MRVGDNNRKVFWYCMPCSLMCPQPSSIIHAFFLFFSLFVAHCAEQREKAINHHAFSTPRRNGKARVEKPALREIELKERQKNEESKGEVKWGCGEENIDDTQMPGLISFQYFPIILTLHSLNPPLLFVSSLSIALDETKSHWSPFPLPGATGETKRKSGNNKVKSSGGIINQNS